MQCGVEFILMYELVFLSHDGYASVMQNVNWGMCRDFVIFAASLQHSFGRCHHCSLGIEQTSEVGLGVESELPLSPQLGRLALFQVLESQGQVKLTQPCLL